MCDTCGCNVTHGNRHIAYAKNELGVSAVTVLKNLLSENDMQAAHNRAHFDRQGIFVVNLMSAPGSGKTALLEATIDALRDEFRLAVIEGDLETENDAERIRKKGIPAHQITTGSACHLDAHMIHATLHQMNLTDVDILFIENVGNLVCPASFDMGQHANVTLLSVTEGDDKPAKYPVMFRAADAVVLSKVDLLPVLDDFKPILAEYALRQLASSAPLISLSSKTQAGLTAWLEWLREQHAAQRERVRRGEVRRPKIQGDGVRFHAASV